MYAVIETGGKQYKVEPGEIVEIERLPDKAGEPIEFDQVLFYSSGEDDIRAGRPHVEGVRVIGSVVDHPRGKKQLAATFKRRKGYRRTKGHRQNLTRVVIDKITVAD
jgi:large subunit ribosomal protein L21